jgi:hypothetical protein
MSLCYHTAIFFALLLNITLLVCPLHVLLISPTWHLSHPHSSSNSRRVTATRFGSVAMSAADVFLLLYKQQCASFSTFYASKQ